MSPWCRLQIVEETTIISLIWVLSLSPLTTSLQDPHSSHWNCPEYPSYNAEWCNGIVKIGPPMSSRKLLNKICRTTELFTRLLSWRVKLRCIQVGKLRYVGFFPTFLSATGTLLPRRQDGSRSPTVISISYWLSHRSMLILEFHLSPRARSSVGQTDIHWLP